MVQEILNKISSHGGKMSYDIERFNAVADYKYCHIEEHIVNKVNGNYVSEKYILVCRERELGWDKKLEIIITYK